MSETPTRRAEIRAQERGGASRRGRTIGIVLAAVAVVAAAAVVVVLVVLPALEPEVVDEVIVSGPVARPEVNTDFQPRPLFDKSARSLDDPTSLWVVVNKLRPFDPPSYVPPDLEPVPVPYVNQPFMRPAAAKATVKMFADFESETGLRMQALSTYRSYAAQQQVYGGNDLLTARPGFSEHQTGWVIDVDALPRECSLALCFADTPQGEWLARNAADYGFIIRYPNGKTDVTGYQYEPWHLRYVGVPLATEMRDTGITTMEEFFGLPAAPAYR